MTAFYDSTCGSVVRGGTIFIYNYLHEIARSPNHWIVTILTPTNTRHVGHNYAATVNDFGDLVILDDEV